MKKATIIGHFGFGMQYLDGQTIKTKIVTKELERRFGEHEMLKTDTHGGTKVLLKAPLQVFKALKSSRNVIIFPAHNGLRVYAPLLSALSFFFKNRKIHYVVIGGWLPEFLKDKGFLSKQLKCFDGIYVETSTMKKALEKQGFENVVVMPNCKDLHILEKSELIFQTVEPYRLCTFSRVMKEKGIEDAIEAVKMVNSQCGRAVYTLDIYGQVDGSQIKWFDELEKSFPAYVKYGGIVPFDQSVEVLKNYFALLFPTRFFTEGIPGTVIDAYAAGVPVISSRWESFADVIEDRVTGIGYEFADFGSLKTLLLNIASRSDEFSKMKDACISKAKEYAPEIIITRLADRLE